MRYMGHFPGFYQYGHGPGMMGGGFIMMFLGLILIGVLIFLIFRNQNGVSCSSSNQLVNSDNRTKALAILEERYAKGEIDTEEFQTRKTELTK